MTIYDILSELLFFIFVLAIPMYFIMKWINSKNKCFKKIDKARHINLQINDQVCWMCGMYPMSHHHAIPRRYKPLHNVKIPLCNKCHAKLHENDYKTKR